MAIDPNDTQTIDAFPRVGYLKQDRKEKPMKGGYRLGVAWRVVNDQGEDWFQPWCDTRREAIDTAKELGITLNQEES